jgi:hypothetical protein
MTMILLEQTGMKILEHVFCKIGHINPVSPIRCPTLEHLLVQTQILQPMDNVLSVIGQIRHAIKMVRVLSLLFFQEQPRLLEHYP